VTYSPGESVGECLGESSLVQWNTGLEIKANRLRQEVTRRVVPHLPNPPDARKPCRSPRIALPIVATRFISWARRHRAVAANSRVWRGGQGLHPQASCIQESRFVLESHMLAVESRCTFSQRRRDQEAATRSYLRWPHMHVRREASRTRRGFASSGADRWRRSRGSVDRASGPFGLDGGDRSPIAADSPHLSEKCRR